MFRIKRVVAAALALLLASAPLPVQAAGNGTLSAGSEVQESAVIAGTTADLAGIPVIPGYEDYEIIPTDVSEASDGCLMLGLPGAYLTDVQGALDQINAIRYEACEEGVRDPRTGEALTLDDYVPIRWSGDLEYIARIRAAEAAVTWNHIRTNGNRWFAISRNGVSASGEVLAWNNSSSVIYGINQWYGEKSAWVNQTGGVTGHYTSMIDPDNRYVGIGTFLSNNTRWFNSTAGEFSRSSSLNETPLNIEDTDCIQILEVNAGLLSGTPTIRGTLTGKAGDESALYVTTNANNGITTKNLLVMDDITWSSDDTSAATVSADGVVKAKACGDPVITAKVRNVLTAQAVYAIEHTWKDGASFTWEADYSAATATFTCANKSSHKKTVDATVTSKVTKEATDTTEGLMVYTATVTFNGKTYTDSVEKTIPRLDHMHTYSNPVWTWSADYKTAKAQFTCSGCGDVQIITATVTSEKTQPTCTGTGLETFTASVDFSGRTYTDSKSQTIAATGHTYTSVSWTWTWNASTPSAEAAFTCSVCGEKTTRQATVTGAVTVEPTCSYTGIKTYTASVTYQGKTYKTTTNQTLPALGHRYGSPEWEWADDYTSATATFTCANDSSHVNVFIASVSSTVTKPATEKEEGIITYTASVTFDGKKYSNSVQQTIPKLDHTHAYSAPVWKWASDYKTASASFTCSGCGDVKKINANVTSVRYEPTCTAEGSETFTAKVSFEGKSYTDTRKLTYPALGHQDDGTGRCSRCGTVLVNLSSTTPDLVNTAKGIKLTFKKVDGATHYEICRRLKSSEKGEPVETSFTLVTTIPATINNSTKINYYDSATATGKNGNTYVYYIRPVIMDNGSVTIAGPTKNVQVRRVSTPEIKSCVNSGAGKVTIKWSKNSLCTGYDVWYSDGKNKTTIRINSNTTVSKVISGLTKGKTYTFKVRSFYKTSSGTIYKSAWKPAEVYISK